MNVEHIRINPVNIETIIIADDDLDDQLIFRQAMHEVAPHIKLEATKDGNELLSLLQSYKPDLLFLDLDMPAKNGLECLKAIRSNPVYADMIVIVFSSTTRPANIEVAYEMGADLFFIKPSFYQELIDTLHFILKADWTNATAIQNLKLKSTPFLAKNDTTQENANSPL